MARSHARRARALVGTRCRPQGRVPQFGIDCIGLAAFVFRLPAEHVPSDYRLRGDHEERLRAALGRFFRDVSPAKALPGDLLLLRVATDQLHLAVLTEAGFVHADAARRRVVEVPQSPRWPLVAAYRARRMAKG